MSVGQYCNRQVVTTERTTEIREIARMMRHHHVGTVVVVERRGDGDYPVGIVTDRNLVVEVLAQNLSREVVTVGDVMSSKLLTARAEDNFWRTQQVIDNERKKEADALAKITTLEQSLASLQ